MPICAECQQTFTSGIPLCPHCGATAGTEEQVEARDPLVGRILARKFRVISVLGEGGMGRVYMAEQVPLGVDVVIKTLHRHMAAEAEVVKRFFREAQSASRLRHPNCIAILDFGEDDGTVYMAMEFLRGVTLGDLADEFGPLPAARVVDIMSQVADVVEAAHRMSIIHRDLKPDNIMVEDLATRRDFAKVLDFGIAKIVDPGGGRLTQTGMIIGTPAYMAPEQARGEEIDNRTDIYAMGVITFELLTGKLPFEANSSAQFLAAHALSKPPPLLSVRPDLPPALASLIDRVLAKNPAERPQSALDLKEALVAALATAPPPASGIGTAMLPAGSGATPASPAPDTEHGIGVGHPPCPRCGIPVPPSAKFCPECGATTGHSTRATKLGDKFSDLRRFLPSGIVDELAGVADAPVEKRDIVALAMDLSGPAMHDADAELSARTLAELYDGLTNIALRHTGVLERRATSSIIVFGLSVTHADDAERAVRAALEARAYVADFNGNHPLRVDVSLAVHTGSAMIEAGLGTSYTPVGDTIELPTRLAAASDSGRIIVTEKIRQLVHGAVKLRRLASVRLKGRSAAVATFEALEAQVGGAATDAQLAEPPMVARTAQLESVRRLMSTPGAGHTVHVVGEPGSGKSRFLLELASALAGQRVVTIAAPARPGADAASPTIASLIRALGATSDALRSHGLSGAEARLLINHLDPGAARTAGVGEEQRRIAIVAALYAALEHLAKRCQAVVTIDDAHLADRMSSLLIHRLVDQPIGNVLLVVASRPGYDLPWQDEQTSRGLLLATMSALPAAAMAELVGGALRPTPPGPELLAAVVDRAAGSPLTALEVLRAMIDAGVLTSVGGRWTVTGDLDAFPRPEGLRALFSARIDALPDFARDVLVCAAVIGDEFTVDLLDRVVGVARGTPVEREVHMLTTRGLLAETSGGSLRFAEQITREITYERLPRRTRRLLHGAIATALTEGDSAASTPPEVVGEHYLKGGSSERALDWLGRGAAAALANHDLNRAERILRQSCMAARAGLEGHDAAACNRRLAEDCLRLGDVQLEQGQLAEVKEILTAGLVCAQKDDDPALIARIKRTRGRALLALGALDEAGRDLEQASQGAIGVRDRILLAQVNGDIGELHEKRGDLDVATRYLVRALELIQSGSSIEVKRTALQVLTALGRVSLRNQQADKGERFLQQGLTLAEELDDALAAAKVLGNLAGVYHARRDYQTARKFVDRALDLSRQGNDLVGTARQLNNLGTLSSLLGDSTAARRHFDAAYVAAKRAGWREGMANAAAGRDRAQPR